MTSYQFLDDLVKEYLLFRGFVATLKAFDGETRTEKEKGLRSDKIVEQIISLISSHELQGLRDLWHHLNSRLFRRLDPTQTGAVSRLESGVLKLYVVNCIQNKANDKVKEFFEKMSAELHGQSEWKEWFALPFLPNPESNPVFVNFFSRQWQDTLMLSLHNFLAIVFASLPPPKLADYHSTASKLKRLRDENDVMRQTLLKHYQRTNQLQKVQPLDIPRPTDVMDDFYIIASHETSVSASGTENVAKGLKGFLRNITGTSAPLSTSTPSGRSEKSRSSSRSRTPSATGITSSLAPKHAPVKRVVKNASSSNLSSSISGSGSVISELDVETVRSKGERMAFLLLGQEEYQEHHSEVTQCKFSNSGYTIASSDVDGVVKVWSASPGPPHTYATFVSQVGVSALDWLPNSDRKFIYGTMTGTLRVCDRDERKSSLEFNVPGDRESSNGKTHFIKQVVCSNTSNLCAISAQNSIDEGLLMLYDLKACQAIEDNLTSQGTFSQSTSVTSCVFNHNAQMIITGASDGKVRIYDLRKRDCISSWSLSSAEHQRGACQVLSLQMSPDETTIYALSSEGQFSAWSFIQTSQKLLEAKLDDPIFVAENYPRAACGKQFAFAGDGKHLLVCSTNGGVIYEVVDDKLEKILGLKGHRRHATCTDWSASNDCGPCVTAGFDGQIRVSTLLSQ